MPPAWCIADWPETAASGVMTTRDAGVSLPPYDGLNLGAAVGDAASAVASNRHAFAAAIRTTPVYLRQVHGTTVVRLGADDLRPGALVHVADASLTTERGIACTVLVADCLPVLFTAPGGVAVAAAHAGWRGLAAGVLDATVAALTDAAGCRADELVAWLGACIGPTAFEVGADVLAAFGVDPTRPSGRFVPGRPERWVADLAGLAQDRLETLGVRTFGTGACTVSDRSRFYSFRRDRVTGRMAAAVWRC